MKADVVIAGAGIAGLSTAYHLAVTHGLAHVVICDPRPPLSLTSDKSTECYRNWWPGPDDTMVQFMNRSIDLLEQWSTESGDALNLSRRGYLYLTADRGALQRLAAQCEEITGLGAGQLRVHDGAASTYEPSTTGGWEGAPDGADLFTTSAGVRVQFPYLSTDVVGAVHARRAGWFSAQQLGMWLFDRARDAGAQLVAGSVIEVVADPDVRVVRLSNGVQIHTDRFVNAAGPMLNDVAGLVGTQFPVHSEVHRKISFVDRLGAVPRKAPLLIWNDPQQIDWDADEAEALREMGLDSLTGELAAGAHLRPDGPDDSAIVLGLWESLPERRDPEFPVPDNPMYPELVMRGLATMVPGLAAYLDRLPTPYVDGSYYTKTVENRPLIGPLGVPGSFVIGALSGFGVMAAPAAGELVALHVLDRALPDYAHLLRPDRHSDPDYLALLTRIDAGGQL